jgi:pyruvate,water dikinase
MPEEYAFGSKVLARFLGDEKFPIKWESEEEKQLMWWYDDLHVPNPVSPMYESLCPWWDTENIAACQYMYRRFWAPFGKEWPGKVINGYVYTTVVPRDPEEAKVSAKFYNMIMPLYADKFLTWWNDRYLPQIEKNLAYLDNYPYGKATLQELLYVLEETLDIFDYHWKLHWILNLAQFQSFLQFRAVYQEVFGKIDEDEIGRILVSVKDKNWESLEGLWRLKTRIKGNRALRRIFQEPSGKPAKDILKELEETRDGKAFLKELSKYTKVYGQKAVYAHELRFPTWHEDPTPVIELLKTYLDMDYDYRKDVKKVRETRDKAIEEMMRRVTDEGKKKKLKEALDLALKMAPLTPDHHFYIDQGTHARARRVLLEIGKRLTQMDVIQSPDDIFFLKYNEMRALTADPKTYDAKKIVEERKKEMKEQEKLTPPDWVGTATQWAVYEEPYKQGLWGFPDKFEKKLPELGVREIRGIAASPGVAEGTARVVKSTDEFDLVQPGDIMVCMMTNPAWINVFPKLKALVTDSGGVFAHPAIVSREFGIPCVVATTVGTRIIKSGQRIRVDGNKGIVTILD